MRLIGTLLCSAKLAALEVREKTGGGATIVGYAARYYDPSDPGTEFRLEIGGKKFAERIMPGAFDATLRAKPDVLGLVNHDRHQLLGRTTSGTLRLAVDERGLRYEIDAPDTQAGRDTLTSLKRGDLNASSFGFQNPEASWRDEGGVRIRELRTLELLDVAVVAEPAYPGTTAEARSALAAEAEQALSKPASDVATESNRKAQDEREFAEFLAKR